jgi:hypothetical protein
MATVTHRMTSINGVSTSGSHPGKSKTNPTKSNKQILKKNSLPSIPFMKIPLRNASMKISNPKNIPSIPKSVMLGVAEPQPPMLMELDSPPLGAPLQDPTASTTLLTAPQVPSLQDETNLPNQVLILQG